jgi:Family of unknown function (DUF6527)
VSKLHEAVYGPDHPEKAGQHFAWYFWCRGCLTAHHVDSRWTFNGDQEKPSFQPSILITERRTDAGKLLHPRCHSFVTAGKIAYCEDSTHALRGKTVEVPDWRGISEENYR